MFVDTPLDVTERRHIKRLYAKARRGELRNFTGIDSSYEVPQAPELHLHAAVDDAAGMAEQVVQRFSTD